jgi:hypothetical protein
MPSVRLPAAILGPQGRYSAGLRPPEGGVDRSGHLPELRASRGLHDPVHGPPLTGRERKLGRPAMPGPGVAWKTPVLDKGPGAERDLPTGTRRRLANVQSLLHLRSRGGNADRIQVPVGHKWVQGRLHRALRELELHRDDPLRSQRSILLVECLRISKLQLYRRLSLWTYGGCHPS